VNHQQKHRPNKPDRVPAVTILLRPSLTVSLASTSARVDEERGLALFSLMLAQADAGAAAVLVDELDAMNR